MMMMMTTHCSLACLRCPRSSRTERRFTSVLRGRRLLLVSRGVATGVYRYIYPKSVYLKCFYVVVLSPWPIYTHPNQIPGYAPARESPSHDATICSEQGIRSRAPVSRAPGIPGHFHSRIPGNEKRGPGMNSLREPSARWAAASSGPRQARGDYFWRGGGAKSWGPHFEESTNVL